MPTINITITLTQTVTTVDPNAIAAIVQWIQTNITSKLPASASASASINNIQL